jgi:hypothetical protein
MFDLGILTRRSQTAAPSSNQSKLFKHSDNVHEARASLFNMDLQVNAILASQMHSAIPESFWESTRDVPDKAAPITSLTITTA